MIALAVILSELVDQTIIDMGNYGIAEFDTLNKMEHSLYVKIKANKRDLNDNKR